MTYLSSYLIQQCNISSLQKQIKDIWVQIIWRLQPLNHNVAFSLVERELVKKHLGGARQECLLKIMFVTRDWVETCFPGIGRDPFLRLAVTALLVPACRAYICHFISLHKLYTQICAHANTITKTNTITNTHTNTGAYTQHGWSLLYFTTVHWPVINIGSLCCTALTVAALSCFLLHFTALLERQK